MKKFIFLDIDGVLNHQLFYQEKTQSERFKEVGLPYCDLDPKKIELLNSLIELTGAQVVISSTWRMRRTVEELQSILEWGGFVGTVIAKTPNLSYSKSWDSVPRGAEIQVWLDNTVKEDYRYVIFDDDSDMLLSQRESFFHVDGYCGLTPNIIYKASRYLNK